MSQKTVSHLRKQTWVKVFPKPFMNVFIEMFLNIWINCNILKGKSLMFWRENVSYLRDLVAKNGT